MLGEVRVEAVRLGNLPPLLVGRLFMFFCASAVPYRVRIEKGLLNGSAAMGKPKPPGRPQRQDGSQFLTLIVSVSWVEEVA